MSSVVVKSERSKILCFVCGSEDVDVATEFDYYCSSAPTTACTCLVCGAS